MIEVDESKLIAVLYELAAGLSIEQAVAINTVKTILTYLGVYNEDNKNILDEKISNIVQDGYL